MKIWPKKGGLPNRVKLAQFGKPGNTMKRHPKKLQVKANRLKVEVKNADLNLYCVHSSTDHNVVVYDNHVPACDCTWQEYHPASVCTHGLAALRQHYGYARVSVWTSEQDARRQRNKIVRLVDGLIITLR